MMIEAPKRGGDPLPQMLNDNLQDAPTFNDPSKRIRSTVREMILPLKVELLRSRLPSEYALPAPMHPSTPHSLEVVVAALLALTDGKLAAMQKLADRDAVQTLNRAAEAARALAVPPSSPPESSNARRAAPPLMSTHDVSNAAVPKTGDRAKQPALRIGHGYDIHQMATRAEAGQPMVIGGVRFDGSDAPDFELGCVANSDGDVIYHSVVDAILGALTMPDIGQLFPDGKGSKWTGADSEVFMVEAYERMTRRGYVIGNIDVTVVCEKPRLNVDSPHGGKVKQMMIDNMARLLMTDASRINVKARTHEKVDSVGECRALEAHAVLILERSAVGIPTDVETS